MGTASSPDSPIASSISGTTSGTQVGAPPPSPLPAPTATAPVPAPAPAPSPTPPDGLSGSATLDSEELAFVQLINAYRVQNGASALQISVLLTRSSDWLSTDMAAKNYFSHTDSQGRDPFTRMADFGYDLTGYTGENIAAGNASAQDTFTQWKNSPAHNANMLDTNYRVIGVGRAYNTSSDYGWYWTTDFGTVVE